MAGRFDPATEVLAASIAAGGSPPPSDDPSRSPRSAWLATPVVRPPRSWTARDGRPAGTSPSTPPPAHGTRPPTRGGVAPLRPLALGKVDVCLLPSLESQHLRG